MYLRIQPDSPGNTSLHHYNNTPTAKSVESQEVSLLLLRTVQPTTTWTDLRSVSLL